ncbi:hypothetical protein sscle_05g043430 [Sclerotinia sclerotiorum 1980 UF-70]|uniref:DUF676 domain-containing protein n=1 Tax=Sclerotinia sclerotiorum (strain ATCC 18683 / 1980 / Ss-1) TaxID=665079 RepID=A0A1D9Q4S4_SCLS1|nr:hypothetical protein sscle_05g043430 [Sclerotinia sclerotiorum 1980 UF-70]
MGRTGYRVEGLPHDTTLENVHNYLQFDPEANMRLVARSVAPLIDSLPNELKVATVDFIPPPGWNPSIPLPALKGHGGDRVVVDQTFYGFTPLNEPQEPVAIDIIAVTGLAGNAFGSWASEPTHMWLRDKLAVDFPNARIMSYGFDSHLKGSQSEAVVSVFSSRFRSDVEEIRRHASDRPLVFIGHSLGGLVIKKAMLGRWKIMPSIPLMIFLGTPHRGLDTEALLELVKHDATAPLIRQISFRSHELNELNSDFCHFLSTAPDIAILSVYETIRTKTLVEMPDGTWARQGIEKMMVPPDSAVLGIGTREVEVPCITDHSRLAKFPATSQGTAYPQIQGAIMKSIRTTPLGHEELIDAIRNQASKRVETLIKSGDFCLDRLAQNGDTALVLAAKWGSKVAVKCLLAYGANPNQCDEAGCTPLFAAAGQYEASLDVVKLLVENDADINSVSGDLKCTPLHGAAQIPSNSHILQYLLSRGAATEVRNAHGLTPLYIASRQNCVFSVKLLIQYEAVVDSCNWDFKDRKYGETPLIAAVYFDKGIAHNTHVIELLVQAGADINFRAGSSKHTALMIACLKGYDRGVRCLLEQGADEGIKDANGNNALMYAARIGNVHIIMVLAEYGSSSIDTQSAQRRVLDWAIYYGKLEIVKYLLALDPGYRPIGIDERFASNINEQMREEIEAYLPKDSNSDMPVKGLTFWDRYRWKRKQNR